MVHIYDKNIGFDMSLWRGALSVEFDLFRRDRDGLLANRIVSVRELSELHSQREYQLGYAIRF